MSGQQNENEPFGSGGHHWSGSGQQQQQQSNGAPGAFGRSPAPVSGKSFAAPPLSHTHTTGGLAQNAPTSATIFGPTAPSAGTFGSKSGSGSGSGLGLAAPQPLHPAVGQGTVLGRTAPNRGPFGRSSGMSLGQAAQVSGATAAGGFYGLQQPSAARAALFAGTPLPANFPPLIYCKKRIRPVPRFSSSKGDDDDDNNNNNDGNDDDKAEAERQPSSSVPQESRKLQNENSKRNQAENTAGQGDFDSLPRMLGGLILEDIDESEIPVPPRPAAGELPTSKSPGYDYYQHMIGSAPTSPDFAHVQTQTAAAPSLVPTLTKAAYWVNPSLDELAKMTEAQLATVKGFCVSRDDYGQIEWLGEVDVRAADLDRCIDIGRKVVSVYEVEEAENIKPEIGCKLNRPATITLYKVLPKNGVLASAQEKEKFATKIHDATKKMDAELLSYNPETGVWRFRVQHFSRYAFQEQDPRVGCIGSIQAGDEKEAALAVE